MRHRRGVAGSANQGDDVRAHGQPLHRPGPARLCRVQPLRSQPQARHEPPGEVTANLDVNPGDAFELSNQCRLEPVGILDEPDDDPGHSHQNRQRDEQHSAHDGYGADPPRRRK